MMSQPMTKKKFISEVTDNSESNFPLHNYKEYQKILRDTDTSMVITRQKGCWGRKKRVKGR